MNFSNFSKSYLSVYHPPQRSEVQEEVVYSDNIVTVWDILMDFQQTGRRVYLSAV